MNDIKERVARGLLAIGAVFLRPEEPFTWASGIKSPIYCDNRLILTAPDVRNEVEAAIAETVRREFPEAEALMGTATAGIAHAAIAAHLMGLPMGYVRSGAKDHGRQNRIEGKLTEGEKVVVIEDLISTGGSLDNYTIGLCGDLKFGRTVHSLIEALSRSTGVKFVLISPEELKLPSYIKKDVLQAKGLQYSQETDLAAVMPELDILYMTRVQRERFFNEEDYLRLKDSYILTPEKLAGAKKDLRILHPLPRVNEISTAIDDDPRACYFRQALCGKYVRMALILKLLEA